jgi:hypothetical protein
VPVSFDASRMRNYQSRLELPAEHAFEISRLHPNTGLTCNEATQLQPMDGRESGNAWPHFERTIGKIEPATPICY